MRNIQHSPRRRRRGTVLVEFAFCIPFLALMIGFSMFLGWAMTNQQKVRRADRWAAWRSVHDRVWSDNTVNMHEEINENFFHNRGLDVQHSESGALSGTQQEFVTVVASFSTEAGDFAEETTGNLPHGRRANVSSDFQTDSDFFRRFAPSAIKSHHTRDGRPWRRHEGGGVRNTILENYLNEIDETLDSVGAPSDEWAQMIRNLLHNGW